jgi:hypothetical protein
MYLRKISLLSLLIIAFALPVLAQEPTIEYGQSAELRGVTKIFVDTGIDTQQRELIVKAIQKRLPNLNVVSRHEESDIHLRFSLIQTKDGKTKEVGTIVKLVGNNRVRILSGSKDFLFPLIEQDSTTNFEKQYAKPFLFAVEFVKIYKKANSESKT